MKSIKGQVVSLKNVQTAIIKVERMWRHPLYKKAVKRSKRYACHVEPQMYNELKLGDIVSISTSRPLSASKHFKVVNIVKE